MKRSAGDANLHKRTSLTSSSALHEIEAGSALGSNRRTSNASNVKRVAEAAAEAAAQTHVQLTNAVVKALDNRHNHGSDTCAAAAAHESAEVDTSGRSDEYQLDDIIGKLRAQKRVFQLERSQLVEYVKKHTVTVNRLEKIDTALSLTSSITSAITFARELMVSAQGSISPSTLAMTWITLGALAAAASTSVSGWKISQQYERNINQAHFIMMEYEVLLQEIEAYLMKRSRRRSKSSALFFEFYGQVQRRYAGLIRQQNTLNLESCSLRDSMV